MKKIFFKKNKGISIIETLFYIVLFAMLSIVVINALLTMMKSFKETSIHRDLTQSGAIMESISREIKKAYGISSINSGDLLLNTKDDVGNNKTVQILLSGSNLLLKENNVLTGNLNIPNITVTGITFTQITTTKGAAIKIVLSIRPTSKPSEAPSNFYDTVILRGSY